MHVDMWLINLLWSGAMIFAGYMVGFYRYKTDHEVIVENIIDHLVDQGFVRTKQNSMGETELVKITEEE